MDTSVFVLALSDWGLINVINLVNATDLIQWAVRRDAQGTLPKILRRLVVATVPNVLRVSFRADEGVQLSGWDGVVVSAQAHAFVPAGVSGWEVSVDKNVERKANEDYNKRTEDPGELDPTQATFVFVTLHRWPNKQGWVQQRREEGKWRDVQAYDADDLETWLESAPGVHIWLSILLGKHPHYTIDLENYWEDWSNATQPRTPPQLVLAGRSEVVERIHTWLREEPSPLTMQAESREEAIAIFSAAVQILSYNERDKVISRTLIVQSEDVWRHLTSIHSPLILVQDFESATAVARATRQGHWVLIPVGRERSASQGTIVVPRISLREATAALTAAGLSEDRARDLAVLARRSLLAFRRKLALAAAHQQPTWASSEHGRTLLPAIFAGSWRESSSGDRDVLASLAGSSYAELMAVLIRWANDSDPPVRRVGDTWYVVSREDAWSLLARYSVPDDFDRLRDIVLKVLGTPDPRFDLPEDERYMAQVYGKVAQWSPLLCRGLAEGLAVIATSPESVRLAWVHPPAVIVAKIVRDLLERANTDWRIWASLSEWGVLPLLAEAAPDVFLQAVDQGLTGRDPILVKLFSENDANIFASSPHTGLLWSLETVAWSSEHLGYASLLLARLSRLDPGGKLANRPRRSLRAIFLPWFPQTSAGPDERLRVIDMLRREEPQVAWNLMIDLLPKHHDVAHPTARPNWRNWRQDQQLRVTFGEYYRVVCGLIERMLGDAGTKACRWNDLIEALPDLPHDLRVKVVERISSLNADMLREPDKAVIWHALRRLLCQHRTFPDAPWAFPADLLDQLNAVMQRLEPTSAPERFGWLFDDYPDLPDGNKKDLETYAAKLRQQREEAVSRIFEEGGLAAVISFAERVECPQCVGFVFAQTGVGDREEDLVLSGYLASDDQRHAQFAVGFVKGRISDQGRTWAERKLKRVGPKLTPPQQAALLACLSAEPTTWELARSLGKETERCYWRTIHPYNIDKNHVDEAVWKFLAHGRPEAAVGLVALHRVVSPSLVADVLESLLVDSVEHVVQLRHEIAELLEFLQESNVVERSRVARLEWGFLPLLRHYGRPKILHEELANNPEFFVEVVSLVFRAEDEEPVQISEEDQVRARVGRELLDSWRTLPGQREDGTIDPRELTSWVQRARELLEARCRKKIGDYVIGEILSRSPRGSDGAWPHEAVRDLIEEVASYDLERGIEIGRYNSRGVVVKDPYEGGAKEREIAEEYERYARTMAHRWFRTAAMLRRLAASYRAEAEREDREAELRQDL